MLEFTFVFSRLSPFLGLAGIHKVYQGISLKRILEKEKIYILGWLKVVGCHVRTKKIKVNAMLFFEQRVKTVTRLKMFPYKFKFNRRGVFRLNITISCLLQWIISTKGWNQGRI